MAKVISKQRQQAIKILDLEHDLQFARTKRDDALAQASALEGKLREFERANGELQQFKRNVLEYWNKWFHADKGECIPHDGSSLDYNALISSMRKPAFAKWHPVDFRELLRLLSQPNYPW